MRDPQNLLFGVFLILLGAGGVYFGARLDMGSALDMGPGYMPTILSGAILAMGVGFTLFSFVHAGAAISNVAWRGLVVVLSVVVLFGLSIKWLGLMVTIVISVMLSALATPNRSWMQTAIFAIVLAAACVLVFNVALNLPLPVWPR